MTAMWPVEQMNDVFLFCNIKTDISLLKTSHTDLYSLIGSAYPYRFKNFFLYCNPFINSFILRDNSVFAQRSVRVLFEKALLLSSHVYELTQLDTEKLFPKLI